MKKNKKIDPIPELTCTTMPTKGSNNGEYTITIPLKYMVDAYKAPAAFFVFKFKGLKYENTKSKKV